MKTALIVGGTAATGLAIVEELKHRGYEVTVYHRGEHEVPGLADLKHIHGEPHFAETIAETITHDVHADAGNWWSRPTVVPDCSRRRGGVPSQRCGR